MSTGTSGAGSQPPLEEIALAEDEADLPTVDALADGGCSFLYVGRAGFLGASRRNVVRTPG